MSTEQRPQTPASSQSQQFERLVTEATAWLREEARLRADTFGGSRPVLQTDDEAMLVRDVEAKRVHREETVPALRRRRAAQWAAATVVFAALFFLAPVPGWATVCLAVAAAWSGLWSLGHLTGQTEPGPTHTAHTQRGHRDVVFAFKTIIEAPPLLRRANVPEQVVARVERLIVEADDLFERYCDMEWRFRDKKGNFDFYGEKAQDYRNAADPRAVVLGDRIMRIAAETLVVARLAEEKERVILTGDAPRGPWGSDSLMDAAGELAAEVALVRGLHLDPLGALGAADRDDDVS